MLKTFLDIWKLALTTSKKLTFYRQHKEEFGTEAYLDLKDYRHRKSLSRIRLSAHFLAIETGRYTPSDGVYARRCQFCSSNVEDLQHLPFFSPVIEDEWHFLTCCPYYHDIRAELSKDVLTGLLQGTTGTSLKHLFDSREDSKSLAVFIGRAMRRRDDISMQIAVDEPQPQQNI